MKDQWLSVRYIPITEGEIQRDVIVKSSSSRSSTDCVYQCFIANHFPSSFYEMDVQMCHCNDCKLSGVTSSSVESNAVYAEYMVHYQKFFDGSELKLPLHSLKRDCKDLYDDNVYADGVYRISPDGGEPFEVYCDMGGGGWTVFQKREDGTVDFNHAWDSYKEGFGYLMGEHWLGLNSLYRLVQDPSELYIELATFDTFDGQKTGYAHYTSFAIGDEADFYRLTVRGYSGDCGDCMTHHSGYKFTTKDVDNDGRSGANCAALFKGAWWFRNCHCVNLNGLYKHGPLETYSEGIIWYEGWTHYYSLKEAVMKTRRN